MAKKKIAKPSVDTEWMSILRSARLECLMEIYEEFDFERMHKVLEFLDWKTSNKNEETGQFELGVMTVPMLMKEVRRLAECCWEAIDNDPESSKTGEYFIATGPFSIHWDESDRDEVRASVEFVCGSWDALIALPTADDK